MKKSLVGIMALLLMASILAACSDDKNDQTDVKENDDIEKVEETEEDANEEAPDQGNDSVEDQRDLTIGETGTF